MTTQVVLFTSWNNGDCHREIEIVSGNPDTFVSAYKGVYENTQKILCEQDMLQKELDYYNPNYSVEMLKI
jgi:hypothetical protein